jgi:flagellar motor switch protein FliN
MPDDISTLMTDDMTPNEKSQSTAVAGSAIEAAVSGAGEMPNLRAMMRIPVELKVVVGSATLSFVQLTHLVSGQIIALDSKVGDKVDVVVNGQVIARGDIVVIDADQSRFGVVVSELVEPIAA